MTKKSFRYLAVAILGISASLVLNKQSNTVDAKSIVKTVMHNAQACDLYGDKVKGRYAAYTQVKVDDDPISFRFKPFAPAYKISGKNKYIKASNIDGVKRKVKRNSYVFATSSRRADSRLLKKGKMLTTYGNSFKFKNGLRYYRIGGPKKQYVKAANLGKIIGYNTEETTVTVTAKKGADITDYAYIDSDDEDIVKRVKKGTKFKVDYAQYSSMDIDDPDGYEYHIKGTDFWIWYRNVKADRKIPIHDYKFEHYTYIMFYKDTDVYNADGTKQDHHGQKIIKQGGFIKVNNLLYIWVQDDNKVELFYHLVGHQFYATDLPNGSSGSDVINVGQGYVKKKDVKFIDGLKLSPINTAEEAQQNAKQKTAK